MQQKQENFDESIVRFIAQTGVSFNALGSDSFKDVINTVDKRLVVKDRTTMSRHVTKYSKNVLTNVCDIISSVKSDLMSIGFTSDMWSSRDMVSFVSLTASFIDKNFFMHRYVPFVKHFPAKHSGVNIGLGLDQMVRSLEVHDIPTLKCFSVNDNASNYRVAIKKSLYLEEFNCVIHTVQLAVRDTFKAVPGMTNVLNKSKAIARYSKKSGVARQELKAAVEKKNLKFHAPSNPVDPRWNSQLDNMKSILPYKEVLEELSLNSEGWEDKALTAGDWALMEGACTVLEPIKNLTKELEGEKEPTINKVVERLYTTHCELDAFINNPENSRQKKGVGFAKVLKKKLNERYPNNGMTHQLLRMANYLDPHFKGIHLDIAMELNSTKRELEDLWNEHSENNDDGHVVYDIDVGPQELSPTSKLRKQLQNRTQVIVQRRETKLQKEMNIYETFSTPSKNASVLLWWKKHQKILPILSDLARMVLAIPASSAKSERVYSTAGNIVTAKRTRLNPSKVEQLIIIKENESNVKTFSDNTDYVITRGEYNAFNDIDLDFQEVEPLDEDDDIESEDDDQDDYDTDLEIDDSQSDSEDSQSDIEDSD